MSDSLIALKQIDRSKLNESLKPITQRNGSPDFFRNASAALLETPEYLHMLEQAVTAGLDSPSVQSGFIAGLRAAVELIGVDLRFADARPNTRRLDVWA